MARDFRKSDDATPIVLMGYYNPIYIYGVDRFLDEALDAGIDGLIVVDLPPEMDDELCIPALAKGVQLHPHGSSTPTTDEKRLPAVLKNTSGFVYYVSMNGITGSALPDPSLVAGAVGRIKAHTGLPVCVRLRRQDGGACARHRCVGGRRRRRHRHRQPDRLQPHR